MNSAPQISVLMTVFNAGRYLAESVESILAQNFTDFEFVIVDDASTDGSIAVLESYASRDRRIRLFCNPKNSGQTTCLNQGLGECRADWVARQDADDISHPQRLAAQWRAVEENSSLVLLGVNGWIMNGAGASAGMIHVPVRDAGIRWSLPFRNPFIHTGVLFRRLHPNGSPVRYDPGFRICQDWELWSRLVDDGAVANLPDFLVSYRSTDGSLSNNFSSTTREESRAIVDRIWRKAFPARNLTLQESDLLESFREGLPSARWPSFKRFYGEMRRAGNSAQARDPQSEAMHMVQAAGALARQSPQAAASAIIGAFCADPAWTAKLFFQRFACAGRKL
jgi:glycosyltransferase involved in cell wall biosynthesis